MTKYALVKMDDYNTTHSTGGVVTFVSEHEMECRGKAWVELQNPNPNVKILSCPEETEAGWIYTDKTNIFVDSNYSTNG